MWSISWSEWQERDDVSVAVIRGNWSARLMKEQQSQKGNRQIWWQRRSVDILKRDNWAWLGGEKVYIVIPVDCLQRYFEWNYVFHFFFLFFSSSASLSLNQLKVRLNDLFAISSFHSSRTLSFASTILFHCCWFGWSERVASSCFPPLTPSFISAFSAIVHQQFYFSPI